MEQMNYNHLLTIVLTNLALSVINLDAVVNTEHVDLASFAEENFCFGWVCSVCFIVQSHTLNKFVVSACNYKECWSLVVLYLSWHCIF